MKSQKKTTTRSRKIRVKIILSYDGLAYCGWQIQPNGITVEEKIEVALKKIYNTEIKVHGSGRTDSQVHADYQVAHFDIIDESLPVEKLYAIINKELPKDIRIISSEIVDDNFHSRFSAIKRVYRYFIFKGESMPPRYRNYCTHLKKDISIEQLNSLATLFLGEHDFTGFCCTRDKNLSKVRTVDKSIFIEVEDFEGLIYYEISANSFLWNMVRSIVGTILEFCDKENAEEIIKEILEKKNRKLVGKTAAAKSLVLHKVIY